MNMKIYLLVLLLVKQILTKSCQTPEKEDGECIPLYDCPKLLDAFTNPLKGSEEYLKRFICNKKKEMRVCCGLKTEFAVLAGQHSAHDSLEMLVLDAFPIDQSFRTLYSKALAIIVTRNVATGEEFTKCASAVINERYILTSAKCVTSSNETHTFSVVGIRFGKDSLIAIEEVIPHPFYDKFTGINDLALLRTNMRAYGGILTVEGFKLYDGEIDAILTFVNLDASTDVESKEQASAHIISKEECGKILANKNATVVLTKYDRCISDIKETKGVTCNAYSGLPIAYSHGYGIYFEGVSSSRALCGDDLPDVYPSVPSYRYWIMNNIRPWRGYYNDACTTPDGKESNCVSVFYCPSLLEKFAAARNGTEDYLRKFICNTDTFFVCCPSSLNVTLLNKNNVQSSDVPAEFLEKERCGIQHRDDYFSSSTAIAIDEYPWIAIVEGNSDICNAILINKRYVISTESCVSDLYHEDEENTSIIVRLGDYNRRNTTDCVEDPNVREWDCTTTELYGIEEKMAHPFANTMDFVYFNNICLLRLNKTVEYTDYIRPICLTLEETSTVKIGDLLERSSWILNFENEEDHIKSKSLAKVITREECRRNLAAHFRKWKDFTNFGFLCTMDVVNNFTGTSKSDYGGPLITHQNYQWYIVGISQFTWGADVAVVYVNISTYVNWILENMRSWQ